MSTIAFENKQSGIERIQGAVTPDDKGIPMNLLEMEVDRTKSIDAATEYLFGTNTKKLAKPEKFPLPIVTFVLGVMLGSAMWLLV